jgi:hypothetical protein
MTTIPGMGAAVRFGVTRTIGITAGLARAALPEQSDRAALRERATDAFLELWDVALDTVLGARLIEGAADRLLDEGVVERVVERAVEHPAAERIVIRLADSPAVERMVLIVVHSQLFDRLLDRVLASEQLDRVVAQIAESDEVHDALREQSAGMADEVSDELRSRTVAADALLERLARSILRRRAAPPGSGPAGTAPV